MVLDLLRRPYELVEVSFGDRNELATVTGGYIYVPVLVDDAGKVICESRDICAAILDQSPGHSLVPSPLEGPIWAYQDFVDGPLEDVLFRISTPAMRDQWPTPFERALYVLIKERKFGAGCVDAWLAQRAELIAKGRHLLAPTLSTLEKSPFLFGQSPTLADAALYGLCAMLEESGEGLLPQVSPALVSFARRLEEATR